MDITVFAICRNEEKILPYFLKHYSSFCKKIIVYDNESDDNSVDIIKSFRGCNTEVRTYTTNGKLDDSVLKKLKNCIHKLSETDLVIVVDCDEFLYHPNIVNFIQNNKYSYYQTTGYDMITEKFPDDYSLPLTHQVKYGVYCSWYSKSVLFDKSIISNMNFSIGSHWCNPSARIGKTIIPYTGDELKLLHYKRLGYEYLMEKHKFRQNVISEINLLNNWAVETPEDIKNTFEKDLKECSQIIP